MNRIVSKILDTTSKCRMIVDNRERGLIELYKNLSFIEFKSLDIGDIQFIIDDNIYMVIERKTLSDLALSIKDGRFREQKFRLKGQNVMYLIEGIIKFDENKKISGIPITTIIGSQVNLIVKNKFQVYHTTDIRETAYFLLNLFHKIQLYAEKVEEKTDYVNHIKIKKKDNYDMNNCFIMQMATIPGVSMAMAKIIVRECHSFYQLCNTYAGLDKEHCERLFEKLEYGKRKIGFKISQRIYQYVMNIS